MIQVKEEKQNKFKDKKILVVGLARSGAGAANLLSGLGARVSVTDSKPRSALEPWIKKLSPAVNVITDGNPVEAFDDADMIVVSPGVPNNIAPLVHAREKGIPVIGELELAYQAVAAEALDETPGIHNTGPANPAFIGITGTNGKSTTTTLIDLMLKESGRRSLLGGNIGNALTEEIMNTSHTGGGGRLFDLTDIDYIVTEISSFQLETIDEFRPRIAALLNITPDHLDRYEGMREYIEAKARIFENQSPEDYLIINADDPDVLRAVSEKWEARTKGRPQVLYFSRGRAVDGVYAGDGNLICNISLPVLHFSVPAYHFPFVRVEDIRIKGVHNLENAMAASLAAFLSGCSPDAVRSVLMTYPGLEHRLEYVDEIKGVTFINDSKGTNIGAVARSLESFNNVILIMGGLDKGGDFSVLRETVKHKVKHLVLIGEAREKIAREIGMVTGTHMAAGLKEAVELSMAKASAGDTVLLSPGCASFDMFRDFEERGKVFKEFVHEIRKRA